MSRAVEKVWNARINVWLRSPGCMAAAGIMFAAIKYGPESICTQNPQMGLILGGLIVFNGQYYQQVVVGDTYRKVQHYSSWEMKVKAQKRAVHVPSRKHAARSSMHVRVCTCAHVHVEHNMQHVAAQSRERNEKRSNEVTQHNHQIESRSQITRSLHLFIHH